MSFKHVHAKFDNQEIRVARHETTTRRHKKTKQKANKFIINKKIYVKILSEEN